MLGRVAPGLQLPHQPVKRHVAVSDDSEHRVLYTGEVLAKCELSGGTCSQHDRVGKKAHHVFELESAAAVGDPANQNVVLAAVAVKQGLKSGQQEHVQRDAFGAADSLQILRQPAREPELLGVSAVGRHGGTRPVGRQPQVRQVAREPLAPVVHLTRNGFVLKRPLLPEGVVGVLEWRGRRRRFAIRESPVDLGQLRQQHSGKGNAVVNDVVERQIDSVVRVVQFDQLRADQRTHTEIERTPGVGSGDALGLGFAGVLQQTRQIHERKRKREIVVDGLYHLAVERGERSAQNLVTLENLVENPLE